MKRDDDPHRMYHELAKRTESENNKKQEKVDYHNDLKEKIEATTRQGDEAHSKHL